MSSRVNFYLNVEKSKLIYIFFNGRMRLIRDKTNYRSGISGIFTYTPYLLVSFHKIWL